MFCDPSDLSKRAKEVLGLMASHEDDEDGELVCEGRDCWIGLQRTSRSVVNQLLECVFIRDMSSGGLEYYVINESGKMFLAGRKPYRDGKGRTFATMFELMAAEEKV